MNINDMTITQFNSLPYITDYNKHDFDSIILLPTDIEHDSGFNYFSVVICFLERPIARTVIYDTFSIFPSKDDRLGIDCLRKSGLMRIFFSPNYDICKKTFDIRKKILG